MLAEERGKIGRKRRIPTAKKRKTKPSSKRESKFTNESESRTEADVQTTDCCARMHAFAQLQYMLCLPQ